MTADVQEATQTVLAILWASLVQRGYIQVCCHARTTG